MDAVINHMAGMGRVGNGSPGAPLGSAGSTFSTLANEMDFPGVPFTTDDFNGCENCGGCCCINAWQDHEMVSSRSVWPVQCDAMFYSIHLVIISFRNALVLNHRAVWVVQKNYKTGVKRKMQQESIKWNRTLFYYSWK